MQVQFRTEPHLITSFRPVRGVSFISPLARERSKSKGMQGKRIITWWVSGFPFISYGSDRWIQRRPVVTLTPYHPFIVKNETEKKNKTTTSICYHHYDNYYTERNRFRPFSFCFVFSNRFFFSLHTLHLYVKRISKDAGWFWIWSCIIVSDKVIRDLLIKSSPTLTIQKLIPKSRLPRFPFCFSFVFVAEASRISLLWPQLIGPQQSRPYGTMRTSCVSRQIGKVDSLIRFFKLSYVCTRPTDSSTC